MLHTLIFLACGVIIFGSLGAFAAFLGGMFIAGIVLAVALAVIAGWLLFLLVHPGETLTLTGLVIVVGALYVWDAKRKIEKRDRESARQRQLQAAEREQAAAEYVRQTQEAQIERERLAREEWERSQAELREYRREHPDYPWTSLRDREQWELQKQAALIARRENLKTQRALERIQSQMTPAQIAKAEKMARERRERKSK